MADELERPGEEPEDHEAEPHLPSPTIWPFAFAAGVALLLVGLIINLYPRRRRRRGHARLRAPLDPRGHAGGPAASRAGSPTPEPVSELAEEEEGAPEPERYPRSAFLELSTLGVGPLIGGIVTLPALGFMVAPAFVDQELRRGRPRPAVTISREDQWMVATFHFGQGRGRSVGRRTAFIRNNGVANGVPSMTIISNRCVHMGCPTQPGGLLQEPQQIETECRPGQADPHAGALGLHVPVPRRRVQHGGQPHGRAARAGPRPLSVLDQEREPRPWEALRVAFVEGEGAQAQIQAYGVQDPGQHVDGPEQYLYPPKFWIP